MNTRYNIKIKTLTPIHIGDGNTASGLEYFCYQERIKKKEDKINENDQTHISWLYKFDIKDFINILDDGDRDIFQKILKEGDVGKIRGFFYKCLESNWEIKGNNKIYSNDIKYKNKFLKIKNLKKIKITNNFYNHWKDKILGTGWQSNGKTLDALLNEKENQKSQMNIKTFINSMGRYYIPGSSLKGAIRTVLTNEIIEYNFKNHKVIKDPFKKIIVQDSDFLSGGSVFVDSLSRIGGRQGKNKQGDGIYAEFIKIGQEVKTKILIKEFIDEKNLENINFDKLYMCKTINNYLFKKLSKYIDEIELLLKTHKDLKGTTESVENKIKKLNSVKQGFENILSEISSCKENECILNIGFGGGYWFKLFDGQKEKHPKFCSIHKNWEPDKGCERPKKNNQTGCNIIAGMPVKHLKDNNIQIPRTNRTTNLENLGFIKLTFTD